MILVAIVGLGDDAFSSQIVSGLSDHEDVAITAVPSEDKIPDGEESLLIIRKGGRKGRTSEQPRPLVERIYVGDNDPRQLMFLINAKLGLMANSSYWNTGFARRKLLLGFRGGFASYISDAPRISDACETKFGCSKCVDLCPAKALRTNERNEIVVSEHECTRCGLCASTCPVSAIQLPRFSESAFLGLIAGLEKSEAPKKTLVLTCDESRVKREPWMYVQEVKDVGIIGRRHTAIAASSNLGAIIVYCADGECVGKQKAKESAESVRSVVRPGSIAIEYLEGVEAAERIEEIHSMSKSRKETLVLGARSWDNYVKSLKYITRSDASLEGLGLTNLLVSDACTLCNACAISCPHSSIRLTSGKIQFDSSTCTGCGNCASVCPEHAVSLKPLVLISDLSPRVVYHDDEIVNCLRCGKPLDSAKFLKRVASLAGTEDRTTTMMIQYCQECKQKVAFERLFKTVQSPAK